jgi:hypothetical protein
MRDLDLGPLRGAVAAEHSRGQFLWVYPPLLLQWELTQRLPISTNCGRTRVTPVILSEPNQVDAIAVIGSLLEPGKALFKADVAVKRDVKRVLDRSVLRSARDLRSVL